MWLPSRDESLVPYWSHSVVSVGNPLPGLLVTPPVTDAFRTSVWSFVLMPAAPFVQAPFAGCSPTRPMISAYEPDDFFQRTNASSPLKSTAVAVEPAALVALPCRYTATAPFAREPDRLLLVVYPVAPLANKINE